MSIFTRTNFVRRSLMLAAVCGASAAAMSAQTSKPAATTQGQAVAAPAVDFKSYISPVFATSAVADDAVSSSSSSSTADDVATVSTDPLHLNAMQYNGRRRYGRPRYRGGNTNADGSNKWMFYGGAGLAQPAGNTWKYFTPSYGIQVGGGRQFSKNFAVPIEFDYDRFGLTGQTIYNQLTLYTDATNLYNTSAASGCQTNPTNCATAPNPLDGNAHVWSFSVDPTYTLAGGTTGDGAGVYVVAGVGFYHKVTNFLTPESEEYCDPYYGICEPIEVNGVYDHYTSNAPGFSAGLGATYKYSHFSGERFYVEARYVFVDNSQRAGVTVNTINASNIFVANDFPANSNRTSYFPIKAGIRF